VPDQNGPPPRHVAPPPPKLVMFATQVQLQQVRHAQLGEMARLALEAGGLTVEVMLPLDYVAELGKELSLLGGGPIIARPGDIAGGGR